jgi:hypothetical protein
MTRIPEPDPTLAGPPREAVLAGAAAGALGGALMLAWIVGYSAASGAGAMVIVKAIAATVLGVHALVGGAGAVLVGLFIHVAVAGVWGMLFALLVRPGANGGAALVAGIVAGLVVLLVMTYLIIPWADPVLRARVDLMTPMWALSHVLFGVGLGALPWLRDRLHPSGSARTGIKVAG